MGSGRFKLIQKSPDLPYVVYLQGWAHNWQLMSGCSINANSVYVCENIKRDTLPRLADFLKCSCKTTASIVGWSLGGFAAVDFARMHPELVKSLVLVGIRRRYTSAEIQASKDELNRDHRTFLEGFYKRTFLPAQRREWAEFKSEMLDFCLKEMDTDALIEGLDYLSEAQINEESLSACRTIIVHGGQDVIAPVEDARRLAEVAGVPIHVIEDASHAAFLHKDFPEVVERWLR